MPQPSSAGTDLPSQPSLRRLKAFGIRPKRDLGQNFLIDSNILGVIARIADVGRDDVVLEIGGGLGVLSEFLAERCRHVHVVELDRALEPALRDALDPHPNTTLHLADAAEQVPDDRLLVETDAPYLTPQVVRTERNQPAFVTHTARFVAERLDECIEQGWWISFAGNVTYPKAQDLAAAAERVPAERLLVETDAPYLTPQVVRKERNQPAFVAHTARFVAERRGVPYEELEAQVERNAAALFGWD